MQKSPTREITESQAQYFLQLNKSKSGQKKRNPFQKQQPLTAEKDPSSKENVSLPKLTTNQPCKRYSMQKPGTSKNVSKTMRNSGSLSFQNFPEDACFSALTTKNGKEALRVSSNFNQNANVLSARSFSQSAIPEEEEGEEVQ